VAELARDRWTVRCDRRARYARAFLVSVTICPRPRFMRRTVFALLPGPQAALLVPRAGCWSGSAVGGSQTSPEASGALGDGLPTTTYESDSSFSFHRGRPTRGGSVADVSTAPETRSNFNDLEARSTGLEPVTSGDSRSRGVSHIVPFGHTLATTRADAKGRAAGGRGVRLRTGFCVPPVPTQRTSGRAPWT
jgi:hypothetical protein